jgi:hypothetical protein
MSLKLLVFLILTFSLVLAGCGGTSVGSGPTLVAPAPRACWAGSPILKTTDVQSINCRPTGIYPNADTTTKVIARIIRPDGTWDPLVLIQQEDTFTAPYQALGAGSYSVEIKIIAGDTTSPETLTFDVTEP